MNKIILKFLIIVFLLSGKLFADSIDKINITGNKRISNETILVLGKIVDKKNFNENDLNNLLKTLYETNFFSDIELSIADNTLNIKIEENPIIENIEITGIKNKTFIKELLELISLKDRMSFSEIQLRSDINKLKNILKTNGFYFAKVNSSLIRNEELNSVKLRINIDQGKKAKIQNIIFIGDKKIKDKKLLEVIASEEHKFWKFISRKVYLNKSLIDLDKRLLENYYKNQGYYKVKVLSSFAELTDEEVF